MAEHMGVSKNVSSKPASYQHQTLKGTLNPFLKDRQFIEPAKSTSIFTSICLDICISTLFEAPLEREPRGFRGTALSNWTQHGAWAFSKASCFSAMAAAMAAAACTLRNTKLSLPLIIEYTIVEYNTV